MNSCRLPVVVLSVRRHPVLLGDAVVDANHELSTVFLPGIRLLAGFLCASPPSIVGMIGSYCHRTMGFRRRRPSRPSSLPTATRPCRRRRRRDGRWRIGLAPQGTSVSGSPGVVPGNVGRPWEHRHARRVWLLCHCFQIFIYTGDFLFVCRLEQAGRKLLEM